MPNYVQQNGTQSTLPGNDPQKSQVYSHFAIGDHASMSSVIPALAANSIDPPDFAATFIAEAVLRQFGLQGSYSTLVSERDQNFCLRADDGSRYVVKVVGAAEEEVTTDFQIELLRYLRDADDVVVPAVVPTVQGAAHGEIASSDTRYRLRVMTWVAGELLESGELDRPIVERFGAALARLGRALEGYSHRGENTVLAWDLQRVVDLRSLVDNIDDTQTRAAVSSAIDDYASRVAPVKLSLPSQVIHGDANPGNVLVTDDGIGFIDFSDSVRAPRVFDLAIAAAYLRPKGDDPSVLIAPFVSAYQSAAQLEPLELALLFDLIRARMATTITMLYWRLSARDADDPYRQKTLEQENGAPRVLAMLDDLGRDRFSQKLIINQ